MVTTIIAPLLREILDGWPACYQPRYYRQDGVWVFPNKSEIWVAGCDNGNAERLRGPSTHRAIVDEAAFIDDLEYVVQSILLPQTMTVNGKILLTSTPPRSPVHPFTKYAVEAQERGAYFHATIYDAPHISDETRAEYMVECGGEDSSAWKREYLAQFVVDEESAVVPEFQRNAEFVVEARERPKYATRLVAMDVGYNDLTVGAFGYYDFENALDVIEGEITLQHATSDLIDAEAARVENELWPGQPLDRQTEIRVVDAPLLVVAELSSKARGWSPARKDDADAALNALRRRVGDRKIRIHPRCKTIISHLHHGTWNTARTSYERSGGFGHFDGIDAVKYFVRHLNRDHNPFPRIAEGVTTQSHYLRPDASENTRREALRKMVNRK